MIKTKSFFSGFLLGPEDNTETGSLLVLLGEGQQTSLRDGNWYGDTVQVVEHLPSKIGVPNSSIVKKQTKNPRSDI
jgi:hypothetical protein